MKPMPSICPRYTSKWYLDLLRHNDIRIDRVHIKHLFVMRHCFWLLPLTEYTIKACILFPSDLSGYHGWNLIINAQLVPKTQMQPLSHAAQPGMLRQQWFYPLEIVPTKNRLNTFISISVMSKYHIQLVL